MTFPLSIIIRKTILEFVMFPGQYRRPEIYFRNTAATQSQKNRLQESLLSPPRRAHALVVLGWRKQQRRVAVV